MSRTKIQSVAPGTPAHQAGVRPGETLLAINGEEIIDQIENASADKNAEADLEDEADPMLGDAIDVVMETGQASASFLQRRLKLGYARAARIVDQMEARGIIGPMEGAKPRQILISKTDWQEMKLRYGVRS